MIKKIIRKYFVFGTLYEDKILKALLGYVPKSYEATLQGYGVFRGKCNDIPEKVKETISPNHDLANFSFLFAKKDKKSDMKIQGKVLEINEQDEKLFDIWERYPTWYGKDAVYVVDGKRMIHEVNVYTINMPGEYLPVYKRVQGNVKTYVQAARKLRAKYLPAK